MRLPNSSTRIDEIVDGVFRISTSLPIIPGGFTFNQILVRDEQPLLFHSGMKGIFGAVRDAVATVLPPSSLRYVAFSHLEADETGALNDWLAIAPDAQPICSELGAMVCLSDSASRPARALKDGERLDLGEHQVRWCNAPHLPHGLDCGFLFEERTRTLFCGDLFAHAGSDPPPITEGDIFGPSEEMRVSFPYAPIRNAQALLMKLSELDPRVLACMHGASFRGDGASLLRELGKALA
jgi:flavorubredoxin